MINQVYIALILASLIASMNCKSNPACDSSITGLLTMGVCNPNFDNEIAAGDVYACTLSINISAPSSVSYNVLAAGVVWSSSLANQFAMIGSSSPGFSLTGRDSRIVAGNHFFQIISEMPIAINLVGTYYINMFVTIALDTGSVCDAKLNSTGSGFPSPILVDNDINVADILSPLLFRLQTDKSTYMPGQNITLQALVMDQNLLAPSAWFTVATLDNQQLIDCDTATWVASPPSPTLDTNGWQNATCTIPMDAVTGTYHLLQLNLADKFGNVINYLPDYWVTALQFTIVNSNTIIT